VEHGRLLGAFLVFSLACQVLIALGVWSDARVAIRAAPFLASVAMLFAVAGPRRAHKSIPLAVAALAITWLQMLNPNGGGAVAALAQACLSTAVLAPVFWANRLRIDRRELVLILSAWWIFHIASATLGILQIYWPDTFVFGISDRLKQLEPDYLESLMITRSDGVQVFRPTGLTDVPGGATTSALYAFVIAAGIVVTGAKKRTRVAAGVAMLISAACLFVCEVRSTVIVALLCVGITAATFMVRGEAGLARRLAATLGVIVCMGFLWAVSAGGSGIQKRFATLTEGNPTDVYYRNRGFFVEQTLVDVLPEYPLGAGLGRWGTMNSYFADEESPPLHAEVQWTGWAYDGGIPLVAVNVALLVSALLVGWRIATGSSGPNWSWAVILFSLNCGMVALTLNSPVFASQAGIDFWLLNGLMGIWVTVDSTRSEVSTRWRSSLSSPSWSRRAGWTGRI
jgi:hypothetical protein